ncbi:hypothetical protein [Ruminococcus flavefaciens]|uniref:hypothetical protein n=1 Tax=Ruminococcus flavefaciens TaxID=1265 RepID=UPI0026F24DBA|nr:hypothetical protein [Ruminococcus flavefaciens]
MAIFTRSFKQLFKIRNGLIIFDAHHYNAHKLIIDLSCKVIEFSIAVIVDNCLCIDVFFVTESSFVYVSTYYRPAIFINISCTSQKINVIIKVFFFGIVAVIGNSKLCIQEINFYGASAAIFIEE